MKKITILIGSMILFCIGLDAQVIDTARFHLDYLPVISNSKKINQPAEINDTVQSKVEIEYEVTPQRIELSFDPSSINAAKLSPDIQKKLYRNFIKAGFGYPVTPLFEMALHNPDNSKFSIGLNVHHFSSWAPPIGKKMKQYAYYPVSDTRLNVFYTHFFKNQTLYSSVGYNHQYANLYGYNRDSISYLPDPEQYYQKSYRDSINNSFHHAKAEIGLRSNYVLEDRRLKQDVRLNYDMIRTHKKDMEHHVALTSYFGYDARFLKISGSQNYSIGFDFDFYNNSFNDTLSDGIKRTANSIKVEFRPAVNFSIKEYHLIIGIGVPIISNYGRARVPVYPIAELQLGLIPGIMSFYFGVDGNTRYNSLENLLYENPYVKPQLDSLKFTRTQFNLYAGIKGNLVKKLNYQLSASYAFEKDHHLYMIDTTSLLRNRFDVVYKNINVLNVTLALNWEVMNNLFLNLDAKYNYYYFPRATDTIKERAWYKPSWEIAFKGKYIFRQKMIFSLNFNMQFDRWALIPSSEGMLIPYKMKPVLDFGLGFEYLITKRFSAFINVNNIACQYYARYYDFPNFGINVLAGITYSFGSESVRRR